MTPYLDLDGDSGIAAFEIGDTWIQVEFKDGACYLYDGVKPGVAHVEEMSRLAPTGRGLNTYINRHVRDNYRRRLW